MAHQTEKRKSFLIKWHTFVPAINFIKSRMQKKKKAYKQNATSPSLFHQKSTECIKEDRERITYNFKSKVHCSSLEIVCGDATWKTTQYEYVVLVLVLVMWEFFFSFTSISVLALTSVEHNRTFHKLQLNCVFFWVTLMHITAWTSLLIIQ